MRKIAALMLVAMAVAAPLRAQTAAGGMGIMAPNLPEYFDETYNRQTVAVQIGSVVEIRLPENPTTGFMWMVDNLNADKLQLLSNEFVPAGDTHSPGGMVGAGGTRVFKMKCLKMGAETVRLIYTRPWWENSTPAKTFSLRLEAVMF
ncbi:MAG: protease inhibitor I42 family protein [Elusimicrobiota bacterium]